MNAFRPTVILSSALAGALALGACGGTEPARQTQAPVFAAAESETTSTEPAPAALAPDATDQLLARFGLKATPTPAPTPAPPVLRGKAFFKLPRSVDPLAGLAIEVYKPGFREALDQQALAAEQIEEELDQIARNGEILERAGKNHRVTLEWEERAHNLKTLKFDFDRAGYRDYRLTNPFDPDEVHLLDWHRDRRFAMMIFDRYISQCEGFAENAALRRDTALDGLNLELSGVPAFRRRATERRAELQSRRAPFHERWLRASQKSHHLRTILTDDKGNFEWLGNPPGTVEIIAHYHDEPTGTDVYWLLPINLSTSREEQLVLSQSNALSISLSGASDPPFVLSMAGSATDS
ncbi:MAG: hypothetical protein RLY93_17130 [Sumerlaeia bacterium]